MQVILDISKKRLLEEVAQRTGYTGAKMPGEVDVYDRIATIDEDHPELMQFFDEVRVDVVTALSDMLAAENADPNDDRYNIELDLQGFNTAKRPAMELALFNTFLYGILGRWYLLTNKEEAAAYSTMATTTLDLLKSNLMNKVFTRKGCGF